MEDYYQNYVKKDYVKKFLWINNKTTWYFF